LSRRPRWWMLAQALSFPWIQKLLKQTQTSLLGKLSARISIPLLSGKNFHITYLPINQEIAGPDNVLLPRSVLEEIIHSSAHRVIIKRCTCRDGNECRNHPVGLGCLMLGEGAREIDPAVGRHVDADEAIRHARECVDNGLIPFVGRFRADNFLWGVRDRGKLLTVCFCCRCCCIIMNSVAYLPKISQDSIVKLKGFTLFTDHEKCVLCGACVEECFVHARQIANNTIVFDAAVCKGCGRCITICPSRAIRAEADNIAEALRDLSGRIEARIDYR